MNLYVGKMRKTRVAMYEFIGMPEWWYCKTCRNQKVSSCDSFKESKHQEWWPVFGEGSNVQVILEKIISRFKFSVPREEEQVNVKRSKNFLRICKWVMRKSISIKKGRSHFWSLSMLSRKETQFLRFIPSCANLLSENDTC
jgi:hypothetical protein